MSESVIDSRIFNEISELMGEAITDFIGVYLDNSPKLLVNLKQAQLDKDFDGIFHNAHKLKGGSGCIGAMQVYQLAKELELLGRNQMFEGVDALNMKLDTAYSVVANELKGHL